MAGAFLSDALRQQAIHSRRGQMMQDEIYRQVSRQIMGQVARQEVGGGIQRRQQRGRSLESAENRETGRDIRRTQFEMQKDLHEKQKTLGLITGAAKAAADLGAFMATQRSPDEAAGFDVGAPQDYQLEGMDFEKGFIEGPEPQGLIPGVSDQLDTALPIGATQPFSLPDTQLELSPSVGQWGADAEVKAREGADALADKDLAELLKRLEGDL